MVNDTTVKTCTRCEISKEVSEFYFRNGKPIARCISCVKEVEHERYRRKRAEILEQKKRYRSENRDEINARRKIYRDNNPDVIREQKRAYYLANVDRILAYQVEYRKINAEKFREQARRWAKENPERKRATQRAWRSIPENRAKGREAVKKWSQTERGRAILTEAARVRRSRIRNSTVVDFSVEQLQARVDYYGGKCWMCGAEYEHMDHVKPLSRGGAHMLSNLRPACAACNLSKFNKWPWPLAKAE